MRKIFAISSIIFGGFLFAKNFDVKITVKQVEKKFKYKKYSPEILKNFVNDIDEVEQEPLVWEAVSGEIIGWENDRATCSTVETFWIKYNKLTLTQKLNKSININRKKGILNILMVGNPLEEF